LVIIIEIARKRIHVPHEKNVYSPSKAEIVRRHLQDQVSVSDLAAELDVQPSQIHQWVNVVLTQAERAFEKVNKKPPRSAKKLEQLKEDKKIF